MWFQSWTFGEEHYHDMLREAENHRLLARLGQQQPRLRRFLRVVRASAGRSLIAVGRLLAQPAREPEVVKMRTN